MTYEIRQGERSWLASDYEESTEHGYRCDLKDHIDHRWPTLKFHYKGREDKRRRVLWADFTDIVIYEAETGRRIKEIHATLKKPVE